jgi:HAD superfamily hydrolase (TIGR01484 family)
MIKAVVLDIDGVVVGGKEGINFPHPSKKVSVALRRIHSSGIPISFLTAKPTFAAAEHIKAVGIDNPHIADGGATIFNPLHNQIMQTVTIPVEDIISLLRALPKHIYLDIFSTNDYYHQKSLTNEFTNRYRKFVGRFPILVDDLKTIAITYPITKINIIALRDNEKEIITDIVKNLPTSYSFNWSTNPHIAPTQVMVVTAKGVSKRSGVEMLAKYVHVSQEEILGVGDTMHDWDFLEVCGYKAVMGNASQELKKKINVNDPQHVIGGHVDDDGILDMIKENYLL